MHSKSRDLYQSTLWRKTKVIRESDDDRLVSSKKIKLSIPLLEDNESAIAEVENVICSFFFVLFF